MIHRFTSTHRLRARTFGIVMLLFVVAGLVLSPFATASADPSSTDDSAQTADATAPTTTAPTSTDASVDAPTTTTAPEPPATTDTTAPPTTAPASTPTTVEDDGVAAMSKRARRTTVTTTRTASRTRSRRTSRRCRRLVDVDGNGELDDYVTIVSPAGTSLHDVNAVSVPSDNPPPDGVTLPYGLFDYDVQVANPGDSAAVTYITPAGFVPDGVHFLQHGAWSDLADRTAVDAHHR